MQIEDEIGGEMDSLYVDLFDLGDLRSDMIEYFTRDIVLEKVTGCTDFGDRSSNIFRF